MGVWYVTREEVKAALDFKYSAQSDALIDRAIESASRAVEGLTHRRFYPETDTRYFPWPDRNSSNNPWRLWLDADEVISVETLSAGGVTIAATDFFLEPINSGPPYTRIEIDLSSGSSFSANAGTHQRAVEVTGLFGYSNEESYAGTLLNGINTTDEAINLPDTALVGVGHVIRIGDERMIVQERRMRDSNQNLQTALTAQQNNTLVAVEDGTDWYKGEVILLDAERMLITDVVGNNLIVKRAWDGTVLAAHTGSDIYALGTYSVIRGALGTTATSHSANDTVYRWDVPGLVKECALAEAINNMEQANSAYARVVGQESNQVEFRGRGLEGIRHVTKETYGRKARIRGI